MVWDIKSFEGVGAIKFGMSPEQVSHILGAPKSMRKGLRHDSFSEFRDPHVPIVRYKNKEVTEIESYYEVDNLSFSGIYLFSRKRNRCSEEITTEK